MPERLEELVVARGRGADCILTVVAGQARFRSTAGDHDRLERWRTASAASVEARSELVSAERTLALQAALTDHYAARS